MAKRPPAKQKVDFGTYLLAKNSKLFRPGAEFMLATAKTPVRKQQKSKR